MTDMWLVKTDSKWRITLPPEVWKQLKGRKIIFSKEGDNIVLTPGALLNKKEQRKRNAARGKIQLPLRQRKARVNAD